MKLSTKNELSTQDELAFTYRVRFALDEQTEIMSPTITDRLHTARKTAVTRKKPESAKLITASRLANTHGLSHSSHDSLNWFKRIGIIIPLLILILGSVGIYYVEQERRINELADLDAAVLSDELPVTAYLDHGFDVYLSKHGE